MARIRLYINGKRDKGGEGTEKETIITAYRFGRHGSKAVVKKGHKVIFKIQNQQVLIGKLRV